MNIITDTQALAAAVVELRQRPFVAVDTEFLRETTFWPKLCLVQIAAEGVEVVIDPLSPGLDLKPLYSLMNDPAVLKVFHAARQDLEIFLKLDGHMPGPVFDTQIGAMACGYGDSVAYDALVQGFLRKKVDKAARFTDWSRRPLSPDQLHYALADVTHLRDLYPKMHAQLQSEGRLEWLADELADLVDPANYDVSPENAWRRLKIRKGGADFLIALQTAAAWRERTAQARDIPRSRVMKDDALYEVAEQRPRSAAAFDRLRAVPKGFGGSRGGAELAAALDAALAAPDRKAPAVERSAAPPPSSVNGPIVELLRVLLRAGCERHGVAAKLIASSADLDWIAADDHADVPALKGWRREVFGAQALALKAGAIALTMKDGKLDIRAIGPA
jgi:ribonuclease D